MAYAPKIHIGASTLTQTTGKKYIETERISARNGLLHRAEIPMAMPVRRRAPIKPKNVIYRRKPRTLSGQKPKGVTKLRRIAEAFSPCTPYITKYDLIMSMDGMISRKCT